MIMFMSFMFFSTLILLIMILMMLVLSKKSFKNREKLSSFECGFDSISKSRIPFSLSFYLIAMIFLIFDVEISLILPMIKSYSFFVFMLNFNFILILLILLLGLILEWKEGALKWFKVMSK
uniref:NADH-ubiquinone oxidoreductase chain 3 n=1 Tax=Trichogramma japonicum TaxID=311206 RepID=A0A384TBZ0_9HYME|nr:NADH dehydrogenase subunit 3 [Trichogramma japonicum]AOM68227.1 NADH dehydrogenase subunit 3 [Trichogramma japonicum]